MTKSFVRPLPKNKKAEQLLRELPARAAEVQRMVPFYAARAVQDFVKERIPKDYPELRRALKISRVAGLADDEHAYVLHAVPRARRTRKADQNERVLYVTAKRNLLRSVPESVQILVDFSPWTADTLPYAPNPRMATVTYRQVSPRVVTRVRRQRRRDRSKWRRRMKDAGIREVRKERRARDIRRIKAVPDLAYTSLRLEFGLGGMPSKPHWRPAILRLASGGLTGMIRGNREISRTMTDPSHQTWQSWKPSGARGAVSVLEAQKYVPFQHVLGIRLGGAK